jgi:tetratricopeptide (TPR) repeat protein
VVQLLIGNTELHLAIREARTCDQVGVLSHVNAALEAYRRANTRDSSYSRPYSGLAVATFIRSRWMVDEAADIANCSAEIYDRATLFEALDYIQRAKTAAADSSDSDPYVRAVRATNEARITYALCALYLSGGGQVDGQYCEQFEQAADQVTNDDAHDGIYDNPLNNAPGIALQAAVVEGLRGYLAWLRAANAADAGDDLISAAAYQAAVSAYSRAIAILNVLPTPDNQFQQMLYYNFRGDIYYDICELDKSQTDFEMALALAPVDYPDKAYFNTMLGQIETDRGSGVCD